MAPLNWATYLERAVGKGHPTLSQTVDRALRQLLMESGYDPDASPFPGLMGPVFNVKAFGAKGDGVTDDTAAILEAIAAAVAALGGIVWFPVGKYLISATLTISTNNVFLVGVGGFHTVNVGSLLTGTQLLWGGASGGTMVKYAAISGAAEQALTTVGMKGFTLRGQNVGGIGLQLLTVHGSRFEDLYVDACTDAAFEMGVVATSGDLRDSSHNVFSRITLQQHTTPGGTGIGLRLTGDATANASVQDFRMLSVLHKNGVGVQLIGADSCVFHSLKVFRAAGGTAIGVELQGGATDIQAARENIFYYLSAGGGGLTSRTAAFPARDNVVHYYATGNGEPLPTIEAGSRLFYKGSASPLTELGVVFGIGVTLTNMPAADTEFGPNPVYRVKVDLQGYSQFRLVVVTGVAGAAGADIRADYGSTEAFTGGNLDGAAGPELALDGVAGHKDTGWVNLAAGARIDPCYIRLKTKDGDGVADPQVTGRMFFR